MAKIYTKNGDTGMTSLLNGRRISKSDLRIESYGTIDELISNIGLLNNYIDDKHNEDYLLKIQRELMTIASILSDDNENMLSSTFALSDDEIIKLENEIDNIESQLSSLHEFVIPGENISSSICHIVRTICRRSERIIVKLSLKEPLNKNIIVFINRLSDYFFVLSRLLSSDNKINKKNL
jgi:cob(I)alamin adenosyltransferase